MKEQRTQRSLPEVGTNPFFQSMQKEMNQFLDKFRGIQPSPPGTFFEALSEPLFPAIDVAETDDAVEITAEIPGVSEDDLDISISQNMLTLKGEKSSDHEEKEKDYQLVERRYGSFQRRLDLGFTPEEGAVDASFDKGVLKMKIAKPAEAKNAVQKIKIGKS